MSEQDRKDFEATLGDAMQGMGPNVKDRMFAAWLSAKAQQWISVKNRLPEDGTPVLAHIPAYGSMPITGMFTDEGFLDFDGEPTGTGFNAPSHWMPLPEPPK